MMIFLLQCVLLPIISGKQSYEREDIFPPYIYRSQPNLTSVVGFGPPGPLEGEKSGRPMEHKQMGQTTSKSSGEFLSTLRTEAGIGGPVELHVSLHGGAGGGTIRSFPQFGGNRNPPAQRPVPRNSIGNPGQYRPNGYPSGYPGLYNLGQNPSKFGPIGYPTRGYPQTLGNYLRECD